MLLQISKTVGHYDAGVTGNLIRCHKILGTPGPQFHHYFGDSFVKLGTPLIYRTRTHLQRGYSTAFKLLSCCQKVREEMVQILHSGGNHRITVSTIGFTSPSTVRVYDSLNTALPLDTKKQIAAILHSPEEEIKLEYANVQVNNICVN